MPAPTNEPSGCSPVPRTRSAPDWVRAFLAALAVCGNVTRAAKLAGVDVTGPYNRRARYPEFHAAWQRVLAEREARAAGLDADSRALTIAGPTPSPSPEGEGSQVLAGASGVRLGRVATSRWSKGAEEAFLEELTASANVARAAAAAGFSQGAIYKRKARDRHFSEGWEAAIAVGRARLEAHLLVAADRTFDPEALPIAEGEPKVTISEAISILKHKPAGSGSGRDGADDQAAQMAEVDAAAERILMRLRRMRDQIEREKTAAGWTKHGDDWVPPGWGPCP